MLASDTSEDDDSIQLPTSHAVESFIETFRTLYQPDTLNGILPRDETLFHHIEDRLRTAFRIEHGRLERQSFNLPTPGSSRISETPFSGIRLASQIGSPLPQERYSSINERFRIPLRNGLPGSFASSLNYGDAMNTQTPVTPSEPMSIPSPHGSFTHGRPRANRQSGAISWRNDSQMSQQAMRSQPPNTYVATDQNISQTWPQPSPLQEPASRNATSGLGRAEDFPNLPMQPSLTQLPQTMHQLSGMMNGNRPQDQLNVAGLLHRFIHDAHVLLKTSSDQTLPSQPASLIPNTSQQPVDSMRPPAAQAIPPTQNIMGDVHLPPRQGISRSPTPSYHQTPITGAQPSHARQHHTQSPPYPQYQQPYVQNPQHLVRSGSTRNNSLRPRVLTQDIPRTPYPTPENNMYATQDDPGFTMSNNTSNWGAQGEQYITNGMITSGGLGNQDLTAIFDREFGFSMSENFGQGSDNVSMNPNFERGSGDFEFGNSLQANQNP